VPTGNGPYQSIKAKRHPRPLKVELRPGCPLAALGHCAPPQSYAQIVGSFLS
jgi:hypothetical protein